MTHTFPATSQHLTLSDIQSVEIKLADVMEVTDTAVLRAKIMSVENEFKQAPDELTKIRTAIIYHEAALNFSLLAQNPVKGYAKKSFDLLTEMLADMNTPEYLRPFAAAYRASALSLIGAETKKLKYLHVAFDLFEECVNNYAGVSYLPQFLRASVAENLPWFFFFKKKFAAADFEAVIKKYENNNAYAPDKIMSFCYWGWAKQHPAKKYRGQSLNYLKKAILLDPLKIAANEKAALLKLALQKK